MKNLNKCLLVSFVLGVIYSIYVIAYFGGAIGGSIATALVTPSHDLYSFSNNI